MMLARTKRRKGTKHCLNRGAADESFCGAVLLTLGRADEVVVLAMIDEPILDVGARLRQPFCRSGILNANHSSLIQLVGDFFWVRAYVLLNSVRQELTGTRIGASWLRCPPGQLATST